MRWWGVRGKRDAMPPYTSGQQWAPTLPVRVCLLGSNWEVGADLLFPESRKRTRFQGAQRHGAAPPAWGGCPLPQCRLGCWGLPHYVTMGNAGPQSQDSTSRQEGPCAPRPRLGCLCARSSPYSPAKVPGQSSPAKALKSDLL